MQFLLIVGSLYVCFCLVTAFSPNESTSSSSSSSSSTTSSDASSTTTFLFNSTTVSPITTARPLSTATYVYTQGARFIDWPLIETATAQLRIMLNVSDRVVLHSTEQSLTVSNTVVVRYVPTIQGIHIYDSRITSEFYTNGSPTGRWDGNGFTVKVNDGCESTISERKAFHILAQAFNVCKNRRYLVDGEFNPTYYVHNETNIAALAYRVSALFINKSTQPIQQFFALLDACTGQVIKKWTGLTSLSPINIKAVGGNSGTVVGQQLYASLPVGLQSDGLCVYSTSDVQVMRSAGSDKFSSTAFQCSQANSAAYDNTNGGYSPLNDVAQHSQTTVDMFRKYMDSQSFQDMLPVMARVHFGSRLATSFWFNKEAHFGDGNDDFYPSTTLDIVAHELGHGYTSIKSKLEIAGEAGGINEAFSDITAQAAVFSSTGKADFLIGAGITRSGRPMRYMCDPPLDGSSIDSFSHFRPDMDAHDSSGLYNKAFCILSNKGSKQTVDDWFQVFAYANRKYWQQWTTLNGGVCGVLKAAWDNMGDPAAIDEVKAAFAAVGLACTKKP